MIIVKRLMQERKRGSGDLHSDSIALEQQTEAKAKTMRWKFSGDSSGKTILPVARALGTIHIPDFAPSGTGRFPLLLSVQGVDHRDDVVQPATDTNTRQPGRAKRQQHSTKRSKTVRAPYISISLADLAAI